MFLLMKDGKILLASDTKRNCKYFAKEYSFAKDPSEANRNMVSKTPEKAWKQKFEKEFNIVEIPYSNFITTSFVTNFVKKEAEKNEP